MEGSYDGVMYFFLAVFLYGLAGLLFLVAPQIALALLVHYSIVYVLLLLPLALISAFLTFLLFYKSWSDGSWILHAWNLVSLVSIVSLSFYRFAGQGQFAWQPYLLALFTTMAFFPILPLVIGQWAEHSWQHNRRSVISGLGK